MIPPPISRPPGGERGKTKITMGRGRGKLKTNREGEGKRRARISHGPRNVKTSANLALVYTQRQLHSSHGLTGKASLPLFLASCLPSPCSLGPLPTKKAQVRAYYNADSISPPTFFSLLARQIRSERERERKASRYPESLIRLAAFLPRLTVAVKCLFFPSDSFLLLPLPSRENCAKKFYPLYLFILRRPAAQQPRKKDLTGEGDKRHLPFSSFREKIREISIRLVSIFFPLPSARRRKIGRAGKVRSSIPFPFHLSLARSAVIERIRDRITRFSLGRRSLARARDQLREADNFAFPLGHP